MNPVETDFRKTLFDFIQDTVVYHLDAPRSWTPISLNRIYAIYPMASLYTDPSSTLYLSDNLADEIRRLNNGINNSYQTIDFGGCTNRSVIQLCNGWLKLEAADALELVPGLEEQIRFGVEPLYAKLQKYIHVRDFTSSNLGTGTNHVAAYCCAVYRAGQVFKNDDYTNLAIKIMDNFAACQHPDGYFSETTPGPAMIYNYISLVCVGRMAVWTGKQNYLASVLRAAAFHRRFSYPDGNIVETFDGRNRYHHGIRLSGDFIQSHTPEGRAFAMMKFNTFRKKQPELFALSNNKIGEYIMNCMENYEYWVSGDTGALECRRHSFVETMTEPAMLRKDGAWVLSMQGIVHLPRGYGSFTIDRSSLLSLWNNKTGLIINGSGEPDESPSQTFVFPSVHSYDTIRYAVPEAVEIFPGKSGSDEAARMFAKYRGGTGEINVRFVSDTVAELTFAAHAHADSYPITVNLQLQLTDKSSVNGHLLGKDAVHLNGDELKNSLKTDAFEITFPSGCAEFIWPHDPYNPYDAKEHKSNPEMYVAILSLRLDVEGITIQVHVGE